MNTRKEKIKEANINKRLVNLSIEWYVYAAAFQCKERLFAFSNYTEILRIAKPKDECLDKEDKIRNKKLCIVKFIGHSLLSLKCLIHRIGLHIVEENQAHAFYYVCVSILFDESISVGFTKRKKFYL